MVSMETFKSRSTIIVGAGWAGLACAVKLASKGYSVTIIEATPHVGGRARSVNHGGMTLDNGQHILLGAYRKTQEVLDLLNVDKEKTLADYQMKLFLKDKKRNILISIPKILAPWHFVCGCITAKGLTIKEITAILKLAFFLKKNNFVLAKDQSLLKTLKGLEQPEELIRSLWEPIAWAALSTSINIASANVFFRVLKDIFFYSYRNSNWLIPVVDLNQLLPIPATNYLKDKNCNMIFGQRINELIFQNNKCIGVKGNKNTWYAENIVLATPVDVAASLLKSESLSKITYEKITTVYLFFSAAVTFLYPIMALIDESVHWIFTNINKPNMLSVVISGDYSPDLIYKQLKEKFENLPKLIDTKVICEKRAAFSCTPEMQNLRPTNKTTIDSLFLAGDYTQTYYPSTLEGAVSSGLTCADLILV